MKRLLKISIFTAVFAVFLGGVYMMGNSAVRAKGYGGFLEYFSGVSGNYLNGLNTSPESINLIIDKEGIAQFKDQREKALKEGVMLNIGDNYVSAQVEYNGQLHSIDLRLKGHMTDHLQEKKWSFRVKMKDGLLKGMSRLTFQHPGTRNYIYEWVFHEMARSHGIIALKYDFVELKINGESWGIYAMEEHFGQELLVANNRPPGPVMRFDPTLYWQGRMREREKLMVDGNYDGYTSAPVDVYDEGTIRKDSNLTAAYEQGIYLIESFRRGILPAAQVFDVTLMAKYLAIIDLVGGYHSLDWSDVKLYCNPITQKIEPIAYESFGVRNLKSIAGQNRFVTSETKDFHQQLFSDTLFFAAYIEALTDLSEEKKIRQFLNSIGSELSHKQAVLAKSFPLKPFTDKFYMRNIKRIKRVLDHPDCLTTNVQKVAGKHIDFVCRNASNLPLHITEVSYRNKKVHVNVWISATINKKMPNPEVFQCENVFGEKVKKQDLIISYQIPGGKVFETPAVPFKFDYKGFQKPNGESIDTIDTVLAPDSANFEL